MTTEETVTISIEDYEELLESAKWCAALDVAGVDNWGGIDEAMEIFREMQSGEYYEH